MDIPPSNDVAAIARGVQGNPQSDVVISEIEDILEHIVDSLSENQVLSIPLRSRQSGHERLVRFPASNAAETKKFTCVLQILHICHEALISGYIITKRNIYYQDPDLFGSQRYVDTLVDDIAFTFGVGRDALNIVAASKGLIAGNVFLTLRNDTILACSSDSSGTLIPHPEGICRIDIAGAKWIVIVEKEATFRSLAASRYFETAAAGVGILITGKGYPDLVTRQFLHFVHSAFPRVPVHALVDFDPSGIDIMLTYKRGSQSLGHEENVTVPRLTWLGPKSSDVLGRTRYHLSLASSSPDDQSLAVTPPSSQDARPSATRPSHVLSANTFEVASSLTMYDRRKATKLLSKLLDEQVGDADDTGLVHELQMMLVLNFKAEIQVIDNDGDATGWLDERLSENIR
ncbi:DNA topoisomerase IV, alpha subunit [Hypoxylon sp. FL1284]|nr:DNA topoisomerase IV, alpha subunit [Hypoxylon sp. FL1284]